MLSAVVDAGMRRRAACDADSDCGSVQSDADDDCGLIRSMVLSAETRAPRPFKVCVNQLADACRAVRIHHACDLLGVFRFLGQTRTSSLFAAVAWLLTASRR
jgi:hypothetical protein